MSQTLLHAAFKQKILVLDGAMGTSLQKKSLSAQDFGGEDYNGCNEHLVLTAAEVILDVHRSFLEAGCDIVETNTFGATPLVLAEYQLQDQYYEINSEAARLARQACQEFSTPDHPRFVAGSMGPTTKSLSVTGGIDFDEMADHFQQQAVALIAGQVDFLLLETALDTLNLKAAWVGLQKAFEQAQTTLPVAISGTIETMGTMLAGQGVEALWVSVEHMQPLYIGLNCATGPEFMRDHIRTLSSMASCPVAVVPNAGLPDEEGRYPESPQDLARVLQSFIEEGWVNMVGGCCGTTAEHIAALSAMVHNRAPRNTHPEPCSRLSGIETLSVTAGDGPYIVGERANVIGSRAFKQLITDEKYEEAAEIGRKQVKSGAHILDVCLSNPDRDETHDMVSFLSYLTKLVKVPLMIDSQVPEVVEEALKLTQGKCILNSINLEDGEKSFQELVPLAKRFGAALVVGCIRGEMAVTASEKLDVARESYELLTGKYDVPAQDIIFDPLVFPCGTGDEKYFGSGAETIEGVRLIKNTYPQCLITLGISNVSFGLPPAGREVLNSVFVYHCSKAGLDFPIVNSQKMVRYATIPAEEKKLCDDLLWYRTDNGADPVAQFAAHFRNRKVQAEVSQQDYWKLPVAERLQINIVQGTKEHLIQNLDQALKQWDALGVINGPLMAAMDVVGRMFNDNELIVAEVLQSAEVMKAAVAHLEQFMEQSETAVKGTVLLATVKGDVHDIGKNLVEIILGNNGFRVINLGIKCPPEVIIEACRKHHPDLIGLSGLLVKSAEQMVYTARDLKQENIDIPILVGGAALSERFTVTKINAEYEGTVVYCSDAMTGLAKANCLVDHENYASWLEEHEQRNETVLQTAQKKSTPQAPQKPQEKLIVDHSLNQPSVAHWQETVLHKEASEVWPYLNLNMLYCKNLGLKGSAKRLLQQGDSKALKLQDTVQAVQQMILEQNLYDLQAVYQFFPARAEGDHILIYDATHKQVLQDFHFPRQSGGQGLCLSDFVSSTQMDSVGLFVTSCGCDVGAIARQLLDEGRYLESHTFFALSMETAEALAEVTHRTMRKEWGIGDSQDLRVDQILQAKYQGVRVSFGYPACPRLEDQTKLWELLKPEQRIGVELTEEYMMVPEASVSALVFHHPQAQYFAISKEDQEAFENLMKVDEKATL